MLSYYSEYGQRCTVTVIEGQTVMPERYSKENCETYYITCLLHLQPQTILYKSIK